jgi:hypothetical protein
MSPLTYLLAPTRDLMLVYNRFRAGISAGETEDAMKETVLIIHGTFAAPVPGRPTWYEPRSDFCRRLDAQLPAERRRGLYRRDRGIDRTIYNGTRSKQLSPFF